jgi:SAM domain (Sterile alpha motif)
LTQSQIPSTPAAINPIVIQLPSQSYPNQEYTSSHFSNTQTLSPENLPSIGEFLRNLDQRCNCDNVYSKFESSFLDEEITVNVIKDLTDEQLTKLGVVKIGCQKNIKQAAQRF